MLYTNQTAEELDSLYRCTTDGIFNAQNSIFMKINFVFSFSLIFLTFFVSFWAFRVLKFHNIYSSGTQFLLFVVLLNSNFNQLVFLEIRIRHLIQIWTYFSDPCKIEFHNSECYYDNNLYMFTNYLATWLVCALTFDRFLAFHAKNLYGNSKRISVVLVVVAIILTLIVHLIIYSNVPLAGYVPSCQYPPQLSLNSFQLATNIKILCSIFMCLVIMLHLYFIIRQDKRIRHTVYDTSTRYSSFENVLTTKSVLTIAVTQLFFSCLSSIAVTIVRHFEAGMTEYTYHILTQYVAGLLYGNLSIPILIYLKTTQCIRYRHQKITKMTLEPDLMESRMISLKAMWEK